MEQKSDGSFSSSPDTSPPKNMSPVKKVFDVITGFSAPWRKHTVARRSRRMIGRDAEEEEEFQYASTTHCLSSYYSVFVVRLAIMVMLAILIGLLTILTWHFTKIYTTRSLKSLAYGLRYEILQRPILRMWSILNSTTEITAAQVKLSEYVIRRYNNPTTQAEQVELYAAMKEVTWALFASRKALNAITINYRNGFVHAFHRDHRSNNTFYIYSDLKNYSISANEPTGIDKMTIRQGWNDKSIHGNISALWYREPLDSITGEKIGKATPIPPDDLINIAGISEVPDGVASWHVAVSKYTDSPLLSAALPVSGPGNQTIVAVVGVTTALYSVGVLMKELVEVHGGHLYLTSQEGYLLATSTNAPLLKNTTKGPMLKMAVDSENRVIRMGARWLQKVYGNHPGDAIHVKNAKLDNEQYYIDSFFLNLKRLPIVGVIIIPRKFIMGKVDERAFKTLIILISASLCILFIGCVFILILTNGVSKEMKLRAELIRQLDARRRAEASSNYKSQFLANMSHELRTPMAAVIGLLDILVCDDYLTNEQYATITQIRKCSTALLRLLNNILDLSKVESGKLVLEDVEFNLGRELEGLVDMFSVQCINHNVETVLELSDDMPELVHGDSARVIQIFTNLISNSIKFTTSGHVILRGWCENLNTLSEVQKSPAPVKTKLKQQGVKLNKMYKKEKKMILWFEVDDTGCGIDPSKWESVFESFEQADLSTTRTHGGTGLGLCIVRTLIRKMGGEITVVKKNGPGTLMRLYLLLSLPADGVEQLCQVDFDKYGVVVLLALYGSMGRLVMSKWLNKHGVPTLEASEWNDLTQVLLNLFQPRKTKASFDSPSKLMKSDMLRIHEIKNPVFVIVVDIELLDLRTDIWKEQLTYLDGFSGKAKFAWMLNHDTSNTVKNELRRRGYDLMVNKPMYKAKMVNILETVIQERSTEQPERSSSAVINEGNSHECVDIDSTQYETCCSDDSDVSEIREKQQQNGILTDTIQGDSNLLRKQETLINSKRREQGISCVEKAENEQKSLQGIRILLAEDTPVLQRVATIMLEKMGASVIAVGDGLQAVDALNCARNEEERKKAPTHESEIQDCSMPTYDLILMDCQMPKMDGYEATKAIRRSEAGTGLHIPIVALTAHAMLSDEAKCLEVGMDAYLTKPINYKLMVSTILSFTQNKS